jgi:hypothetical protein
MQPGFRRRVITDNSSIAACEAASAAVKLGGMSLALLQRKQILVPTWRGWLLLLAGTGLLLAGFLCETVPFLAVTRAGHRDVLVVEGWLPDYALEQAKQTFESNGYRTLAVTGVPIEIGFHISREKNYAQLAADTLQHLGVDPKAIVTLPCPEVPRDRTYATARQVRAWLDGQPAGTQVDVFTLGVHARRTWLLYCLALGKGRQVGIIAGKDQRYDQDRWWTSSSGFRTVTSEAIAYLYARIVFVPKADRVEPGQAAGARPM